MFILVRTSQNAHVQWQLMVKLKHELVVFSSHASFGTHKFYRKETYADAAYAEAEAVKSVDPKTFLHTCPKSLQIYMEVQKYLLSLLFKN